MAFKKVTLEEWKALGLPIETSSIHFGNSILVKKLKGQNKKNENKKKNNTSK